MKVTCNVIRDILPLYVENITSDDTRIIVEEHISSCESCKKQLEEMSFYTNLPIDTDTAPLRKLKATLRKKKILTIIFTAMLTMAVAAVVIAFLTAPKYILYSENTVSFIENDNGTVLAIFSDEVSGYDISRYPADGNSGYVYHITTWDTTWNRYVNKKPANNTVLNPDGIMVASVYYYMTDLSPDILIYGKDQIPDGAVTTLPSHVLNHYALLAIALMIICGLIMHVFRRHKIVRDMATKILLLPVSYLLGRLLIKGFTVSSYSATRDFFAILLVMIPLYIVFVSAFNLVREYMNNKVDIS
jgi:hypothetical protein